MIDRLFKIDLIKRGPLLEISINGRGSRKGLYLDEIRLSNSED